MNKTYLIICISCLALGIAGCDGYSGDCEMFNNYNGDDIIHNSLLVDTNTIHYVPQNLVKMTFSNGTHSILFENIRPIDTFFLEKIARGYRNTNCGQQYYDELIPCQRKGFLFSSTTLPLDINVVRTKRNDFFGSYDTSKINLWKDIVDVRISAMRFIVPLDGKPDTSVTFYNSLQLGTTMYDSVFECRSTFSGTVTYPNTLYYNTKQGVLGYKLTNGELWLRQ